MCGQDPAHGAAAWKASTAGHVVAVEKSEIDDEVHDTIDKYLATYLAIIRFSNWGTNCRTIHKKSYFILENQRRALF